MKCDKFPKPIPLCSLSSVAINGRNKSLYMQIKVSELQYNTHNSPSITK